MFLDSPAPNILPKLPVADQLLTGPPRFVWLNTLMASIRICRLTLSVIAVSLWKPKSNWFKPGDRMVSRPKDPDRAWNPLARIGTENALALNQVVLSEPAGGAMDPTWSVLAPL